MQDNILGSTVLHGNPKEARAPEPTQDHLPGATATRDTRKKT